MAEPVTLIITNSLDRTVDRLIHEIGTDRIFRFNFDLWPQYRLEVSHGDFAIANPAGRIVRRGDIAKLYWRKPLSRSHLMRRTDAPPAERYFDAEMFYVVRDLKNLLARDGKLVLVEPDGHQRGGKLLQMEVAGQYFPVPRYEFFLDPARDTSPRLRVVKSLSSEPLTADSVLWTTAVEERRLDLTTPWLLQDLVDASLDVTVVFVRDRMFAFELNRRHFIEDTVDWREAGPPVLPHWRPHTLPLEIQVGIEAVMDKLQLHYGRVDFLYDGGAYWFLEVNTNGEWDWLDPRGDFGLRAKIVEEIHPDTPLHPIPGSLASQPSEIA